MHNSSHEADISYTDSPTTQEEQSALSLHEKMQRLSLKRKKEMKKGPGPLQKLNWALFDKETFEWMIDKIIKLIADLENLFPTAQAAQQSIAKEDVHELGADLAKQIVECLAEDAQDRKLEGAVKAVQGVAKVQKKMDSMTVSFNGPNNRGVQAGYSEIRDFHAGGK